MTPWEQRLAIMAEAKSWVGTPFHDNAAIKGEKGGIDCAAVIAESYRAGEITLAVRDYHPQWFANAAPGKTKPEELYLNDLQEAGFIEIAASQRMPGDIIISKVSEPVFCHAAIICLYPHVIHACASSGVIRSHLNTSWYFSNREVKHFSWGGWHQGT